MYDLGDASKWEFMFSTTDKPLLLIPTLDEADPLEIDDDEVLSAGRSLSWSFSLHTKDFKHPILRLLQEQLTNITIASVARVFYMFCAFLSCSLHNMRS